MNSDELWDYFAPQIKLWNLTELSTSAFIFLVSQLRAAIPDEIPLTNEEVGLRLIAQARRKLCLL